MKLGLYEGFASLYDIFMSDVDYYSWVEYIEKIWKHQNFCPKIVVELGCGTGNICEILAEKGYDVIGIDFSNDMLSIARDKAYKKNIDILYICQDMRNFELYGTANCIISIFDSMNYITDEKELFDVFKLVNNYLHPDGLFIFDLNTEYKFKNVYSDNTYTEINENSAYIWENFYDEINKINEYYINFFNKNDKGTYDRFEEFHCEKVYDVETIKFLIEKSGMEFVAVYDAYTFNSPKENSERLFFVAKEINKSSVNKEFCI